MGNHKATPFQLKLVRSGALPALLDGYDKSPITLSVAHVVTVQLLMEYTEGAPGGAFEFITRISYNGTKFFDTTIDNRGVLTPVAAGFASLSNTHVHRFAPRGAVPVPESYAITLNRSVPFIHFVFAEWGMLPPGTLDVSALLSGA